MMTAIAFSHLLFWENPLSTLCFFALGMSFLSFWVKRTAWLWGTFLLIAIILAFQANIAGWISLIPIAILFFCHFLIKEETGMGARFILFGIATLTSSALYFHFLPGFNNWNVAHNFQASSNSYPFNVWLNFDKPFIGIFVLAFGAPLLSSKKQWARVLKTTLPISAIGIAVIMAIGFYFKVIKWDPKIPIIFFIWTINNLIFVCIPEEAFFRGFFQRQLNRFFGEGSLSGLGSVIVAALYFTLMHLKWAASLPLLLPIFLAGLLYGTIYQTTKAIEGSILCHFGLNLTHFLLFSYPALQI